MRRLLLLSLLMMLPSCSETLSAPVEPALRVCKVRRIEDPPALPSLHSCDDVTTGERQNCLSMTDTNELTKWIGLTLETRNDLRGCSLVQLVDE